MLSHERSLLYILSRLLQTFTDFNIKSLEQKFPIRFISSSTGLLDGKAINRHIIKDKSLKIQYVCVCVCVSECDWQRQKTGENLCQPLELRVAQAV